MTYVRSFADFAPPPRYEKEADPFTESLIEESDAQGGTYTTIDTIALEPIDTDPSSPQVREFSTDKATLDPAWYRITWKDASGDTFVGSPVYFPSLPPWAPTVADVSALIRARTKVRGSKETGVFNEKTRPTGVQVERLIRQACRRVATAVGIEPCSDELRMDAGAAGALYAAMLVEQSYYPEQTTNTGSSFASLEKLWKDAISTLKEAVRNECGTEDDGAASGAGAAGHFDDGAGLISRTNPPTW